MGKRRKLLSDSGDSFYLPPELYTELLSRLPVRSLLRFRSVCKSWRSLIDNPNFISVHLNHFNNNSDQSHLLILEHPTSCPKIRCLIRRSDTFRKSADVEFEIDENDSYLVVGHINGLLALMKLIYSENSWKFDEIIIWNPSIRKSFNLPPSPLSHMSKASFIEPGLGFDISSNDYKVVLIIYPAMNVYNEQNPVLVNVEVYSTRNESWRSLTFDHFPCLRCLGPSVFISGAIHWLGCDMRLVPWMGKSSHIVSFSVVDEVFGYVELPRVDDGDDLLRERLPMAFGGALGLMDVYRGYSYLWVMDKGGGVDCWSKRYTIGLSLSRVLCFKEDSEVIFATRVEGVQSYEFKSREKQVLAKTYPENLIYADVFVESLVLSRP